MVTQSIYCMSFCEMELEKDPMCDIHSRLWFWLSPLYVSGRYWKIQIMDCPYGATQPTRH